MTPDALIAHVCTTLFEHEYRLHVSCGEWTMLIELFAKPSVIAWMIGREGQMITALQRLGEVVGRKHGLRVYVTLDEE